MGTDSQPTGDDIHDMYNDAKKVGFKVWEGPTEIWCSECRKPHPAKEMTRCDSCCGEFCQGCHGEHSKLETCSYEQFNR